MNYRSTNELEAALDEIRQAPKDLGTVDMIVCRPAENEREVLVEGKLDVDDGLVGDSWRLRPDSTWVDGTANPDMQLTLMSVRVIRLLSEDRDRWPLAGDQFFVDLDLSPNNLPPGTQLDIGTAIIEVTAEPHRGCGKFKERFGLDALKFVNSSVGKELNLRGLNAKVIQPGTVRQGDLLQKR